MARLLEQAADFTGNDRFQIIRRIGAGGVGLVYEAVDREYGSRVALKTLQRLDGEALLRFKNEFRLLQDIHHPNLIQLGELFEEDGHWFFTMELLDGVDFMTHVAAGSDDRAKPDAKPETWIDSDSQRTRELYTGPSTPSGDSTLQTGGVTAVTAPEPPRAPHHIDEPRLRAALCQLAEGLHALHCAGMVHRDIKPHNVMVCQDRVVLLDFGLVSEERAWRHYEVERGQLLGTPAYMAPEQTMGQTATPATDWYAVGTMLYEALTGKRPFEGDVSYVLLEKQRRDPPPPSARAVPASPVPAALEALCMALLAREPADRPGGPEVLARLGAGAPADSGDGAALADMSANLVGRARELAALREALARCAPGRPVVALVHGTSGMGKTALIERFARDAHDHARALVLRGRCYEREAVPYKAFDGVIDELSHYLKHLLGDARDEPEDLDFSDPRTLDTTHVTGIPGGASHADTADSALRALIARELAVLARLFPVLESVLDRNAHGNAGVAGAAGDDIRDPAELRRRAFDALKTLLTRVAERQPLVIIIDDLQWGDMDSAALLAEIISPPQPPGLLLVASYRSEEAQSPLVQSLHAGVRHALRQEAIREIEVGPLSATECLTLARAIWQRIGIADSDGGSLWSSDGMLASAAMHESGGSPFFITEMVHYLAMPGPARDQSAPDGITLDRVLMERRRQLAPAARDLLDVVAVAGRPIAQGVALRAAGQGGAERGAVAALRAGHFVRTRGPGLRDAIETYHDRIREAVVAQMDAAALRALHARLAQALEQDEAGSDAEMLAEHHLGAGHGDQAARWALLAAEHAERALAFDRAAHMYRLVLEVQPDTGTDRRALHIRLGDALASANRGADAAGAYLEAAADAPAVASTLLPAPLRAASMNLAVECKRRAAEQLLRSGSIDEGTALLGEVLAAAGLQVPRTQRRALISLLLRRLQLRLRGLGYRPRPPERIAPRERQRADVCWSGAIGLVMVDPVRGADFGTRALLMALRQGDEARIAKTLALSASHQSTAGGKTESRVKALIHTAEDIARRTGDPHAMGVIAMSRAAAAMLNGRWQQAREQGELAERIFREQCIGVSWEIGTALTFQYTALYYLGEWKTLRERARVSVRRALEQNDLYTMAGLASFSAYGSLMADDVAGARAAVAQASGRWRVSGYHMQNYLEMLAHLQIDLYANDGAAAWQRLEAALPTLSRVLLMRVQTLRIIVHHTRARGALALAAAGAHPAAAAGAPPSTQPLDGAPLPDRAQLLDAAERAAAAIERERVHWGLPLAMLVRAGVAACRDERTRAVALLDRAIEGLDAADMGFFATTARLRKGRLVGGDQGRAMIAAAEQTIRDQDLVNPRALANMLAPGFEEP